MKIGTKVTLTLIFVFAIGILISGLSLSNVLDRKAQNEVNAKALALMEMNDSVRNYTNDRVQPLLLPKAESQERFIPESIPAFSVREIFEYFRNDPEYASFLFKDAMLDPTNLRDKADNFETQIINKFRNQSNKNTISGYRNISGAELYYTARPFQVENESCLRCHSTPEKAPKSQLATYGKDNGFGWELNEVIGTQIVYVPAQNILKNAYDSFVLITGIVVAIFTIVVVLMNLLLKKTVLQRIKGIAKVAEEVSVGNMNADFGRQKKDEIGDLAEAFNRMKYSLEIAMNMLNKKRKGD
ncbi:MAG: DUF3365 domain-containing protein [Rivularia sp. (in: Bacteria)]|nr:DUF3365 domain-containing protein [Rivularia sp. MS3]